MSDILLQAVQTLCDPLTLFCMTLAMVYGILLGAIPGLTAILLSVLLCNVLMLLIETLAIRGFVQVLDVPQTRLVPIIMLCVVGVVGVNNRLFDAWAMLFFGFLGYVFERNGYPLAPFVLGFILGPMVEENTRRTLLFYDSPMLLLERPVGTCLLLPALRPFILWLFRTVRQRRRATDG